MSAFIIFLSSGLLVYWVMRSWLLAFGADPAVSGALQADRVWLRRTHRMLADSRIG